MISFNPCCTGYSSRAGSHSSGVGTISSFNPCCTGYSSRAVYFLLFRSTSLVSILVVLDIAQELNCVRSTGMSIFVSILVVLDIAQELAFIIYPPLCLYRFNPCCTGYSSRAMTGTVTDPSIV
ncbi:hypothetical protein THII_0563 [Thioploca ingrica]|uniref:Uncharacterized protein n=1 Tax=Thioploca ingrica TaxID=40754 RepID=A0A090AJ29_9GAMM|nr:hypothetical protein THII_0563 [Thioploca ingrica]